MKKQKKSKGVGRRQFIKAMGGLTAAGIASTTMPRLTGAQEEGGAGDRTKFLIVLSANGGASIIDSTLAIRSSETSSPQTLNCFPDEVVKTIEGSPLRAVDLSRESLGQIPMPFEANQSTFVKAHHKEMMVATWNRTSVNHYIGQRRSVTGNEAWLGRTMQEIVALEHGKGFAIPNVHLSSGSGFNENGTDRSLPAYAFAETIADPALWPLALDGARGLKGTIPKGVLNKARQWRSQKIDGSSEFAKVFEEASKLKRWRHIRNSPQESIEANELISKLMLFPDSQAYPIREYGLTSSPGAKKAREVFTKYDTDPLEAQAAMAFLLLKYRVSVSVTMGPNFDLVVKDGSNVSGGALAPGTILNPPIAFDFSHQEHRSIQAFMWHRMYAVADGLIRLLKSEPYGSQGESMWDRTMIYIATDFGRTKQRPGNTESFATGHDLNNGILTISPLVQGNKVLGGVDPQTGLTYGFDPATGAPDKGRVMREEEIFSGLLQALDVDTSSVSLPQIKAMRKRA